MNRQITLSERLLPYLTTDPVYAELFQTYEVLLEERRKLYEGLPKGNEGLERKIMIEIIEKDMKKTASALNSFCLN